MNLLLIELKKYFFSFKKILYIFISYIFIYLFIIFIIIKINNNFNNFEKIKINIIFEKNNTKLFKIIEKISNSDYFKDSFSFKFSNIETSKNLLNNNKIDSYICLSSRSIKDISYEFLKSASLISKNTHTYKYYLSKEFFNFIVSYFDSYHPSIISLFSVLDKMDDIHFNKEDILKDINNKFFDIYNFNCKFFKIINVSYKKNDFSLQYYFKSILIFFLIIFTNTLVNILKESSTKNFCNLYKISKLNITKLVFIRFVSFFIVINILLLPFILFFLDFSILLLSLVISSFAIMTESIFNKKSTIFIYFVSFLMFIFSSDIITKLYFFKLSLNLKLLSLNYLFINKSYFSYFIFIILSFIFLIISIIFTKKKVENN